MNNEIQTIMTTGRIVPPVSKASDSLRLYYPEATGLTLPSAICGSCWRNIAGLFFQVLDPVDVLLDVHECAHNVPADMALYRAIMHEAPEAWWFTHPDPWKDRD